MSATIGHWLGGKPWPGTSGSTAEVFDPATGTAETRVALASTADVDAIVVAADGAWRDWRTVSLGRRAKVMFAFRELVERHAAELAAVITAQHGKVLSDARGEIARGLEVVEFACGIPHLLKGGFSEQVSTGTDVWSIRQPLGVVAGITPFNFPAMVPMWMFPIALACGNAFVLKPSERDPGASLLLAEWLADAGLPDGVFSICQGDAAAVDALLEHELVRAVSFVGSTPVAQHVYATATASGKRVQALGGAKNHMIVLPDADVAAAADAAVSAGYGSAGERCMAISVLVAVDPVGDELVDAVAERTRAINVGDGRDPASDMGPMVTATARDRVRSYIDEGEAAGATVVVDGRDLAERDGFFVGPTLFDHVAPDMSIYTDEIFGPVLCVVRAGSYEEAVRLVEDNPYGNGVALFTNDGGAARRFVGEVDAGMVGVNVPIPVPMAYYSFGGWGKSLFGDTHVHGTEGVLFYTRGKVVTARWNDPATRSTGPDLGFPTTT